MHKVCKDKNQTQSFGMSVVQRTTLNQSNQEFFSNQSFFTNLGVF